MHGRIVLRSRWWCSQKVCNSAGHTCCRCCRSRCRILTNLCSGILEKQTTASEQRYVYCKEFYSIVVNDLHAKLGYSVREPVEAYTCSLRSRITSTVKLVQARMAISAAGTLSWSSVRSKVGGVPSSGGFRMPKCTFRNSRESAAWITQHGPYGPYIKTIIRDILDITAGMTCIETWQNLGHQISDIRSISQYLRDICHHKSMKQLQHVQKPHNGGHIVVPQIDFCIQHRCPRCPCFYCSTVTGHPAHLPRSCAPLGSQCQSLRKSRLQQQNQEKLKDGYTKA